MGVVARLRKRLPRLDRYNQLLWAAIGTAAALAVVAMVGGGTIAVLVSWLRSPAAPSGIELQGGKAPDELLTKSERVSYGEPILRARSGQTLIPVVFTREVRARWELASGSLGSRKEYDESDKSSRGYSGEFNNAVVTDAEGKHGRLLFDHRVAIHQVLTPDQEVEEDKARGRAGHPFLDLILLDVTERDTNGDGVLNADDASRAYLATWSGRAPEPVSPAGTRLMGITLDWRNRRVYLLVQEDSDRNGKFDDKDDSRYVWFSPTDPSHLTPAVPADLHRRLESMLIGKSRPGRSGR